MICNTLSNANTSHFKCLIATLLNAFIYIVVFFHKFPNKDKYILVEPFIIPSLGDTGLIFHYAWLRSLKEGKELYTILPKTDNMKLCFEFANIFCKPENIEQYSNPLFKLLVHFLPSKYISFIEVLLLNRLRKKYAGIKTFVDYDASKDDTLLDISNP